MIYRIDRRHFLTHAIDYFTLEDLIECNYVIISAKIQHGGRYDKMVKAGELYPAPDIILMFDEMKGMDEPAEVFYKELKHGENGRYNRDLYHYFINPLLKHQNVMIVCDEFENQIVDVIVKFLHKEFAVDVIDLNELFSTGRTKEIYIDLDEIWDKAVDVRRDAANEMAKSMVTTQEGRRTLIDTLTMKEKRRQLKKLGFKVKAEDKKDIDKLLLEAWEDEK